MRHNPLKFNVIIIILLFSSAVLAQKSVFYNEPGQTYCKAMEMFNKKTYGPAGKLFEEYIQQKENDNNIYTENAEYYKLVCAVKMKESDALPLAIEFGKKYPESAYLESVFFEMGKLYFYEKKYRPALNVFKQVTANKLTYEDQSEYYYKRGYCLFKINKPDQAIVDFEKVIKTKNEYTVPATYYYAHIKYLKHQYDEALLLFNKIKNNRRFSKYIPNYLINIYFEKKEYQKVINEGEKYYRKVPSKSKVEIARLLANSYYELENYGKAHDYFLIYERGTRSIGPEENYKIGVVKYKSGEYNGAIGNFQKATKVRTEIAQSAWYYLGFCYLNTSQDKFARDAFLKASQMSGNDEIKTDALFNYVKTTIQTGGDPYNDEIKILENFINDNHASPRLNEAYDLLVQLFLTSKNYQAALESIDKTGKPNKRLQNIYQDLAYAKGIELYGRSDFNGAIRFFDKAGKYPSDKNMYAQTLFWKGDAYYQLHQFKSAAKYYNLFLKQKSALKSRLYPTALYNLGYATFNQKDYSTATKYLKRFIRNGKGSYKLINDAKLRLADTYYIQKEYQQALKLYSKVADANTQDADYALYQKASCYGSQGNFNKKIETLNSFVRRYRNSPLYTDVLYEIASTYLILHDQRHAIISFDKIVKERPKSVYAVKALTKMGMLYYNNNQYEQAIKVFKQVVNKYPASSEATEALNSLKNIYTETGHVDDYFTYVKGLDFVQISTSEEDSLTFTMGENYYFNNNCNKAIKALTKYVNKFPKGGFVLKSYYYIAACFEKQKDSKTALTYYEKILEFPNNEYTVKALLMSARTEFDNKNFEKSLAYYSRLSEQAESKSINLESLDGMMRSAFYLNKNQVAANAAHKLLKTNKVSKDQIVFAHYVIAKTAYGSGNFKEANREFTITDKLTSGEWGAESKYYQALIAFNSNDDKKSEELIYQLSDQYSDFEYWIAKGFILLADIYLKRDNSFQAEQTLKSIIANYSGEDLKKVARKKLKKIEVAKPMSNSRKEAENE